jgi:hypothetical protein
MSLKIAEGHLEEIKALVREGDVDLAERRRAFAAKSGRSTTLDDENLIRAIAATDDDDDDLFVKNVLEAEKEG